MNNRWLNVRDSAVSMLRIFAVLVVLFLLSRVGIQVFRAVDDVNWYAIVFWILDGFTKAAYYGGIIFALSWIVSLIGRQTEDNVRSGWLENRESAISLLKILALSIVLFCLLIIGIGTFSALDDSYPWYDMAWYELANAILGYIVKAAYYGGTVLALSWIVSLIGNRNEENMRGGWLKSALSWVVSLIDKWNIGNWNDEENVRSGWLNDKESAVSLLRIFALLIVLLWPLQSVLQVFISPDWNLSWEYTVGNIFLFLFSAIYQGGTIFALSWIVSLLGRREADEVSDEVIT